jgi:hypothetical protein
MTIWKLRVLPALSLALILMGNTGSSQAKAESPYLGDDLLQKRESREVFHTANDFLASRLFASTDRWMATENASSLSSIN